MFLTERTLDRIVDQLDFDLDLKYLIQNDEYKVLQEEGLVDETRDHIYVPNGLVQTPCVYKVTKLVTPDLDILKFMDHIIETITLPFEVSLNVGFFTRDTQRPDFLRYVKPTTTQSVVTACLTNLEHYWKFRGDVRKANLDLLDAAWTNANDRRQINAHTFPVCATILAIYIRKL